MGYYWKCLVRWLQEEEYGLCSAGEGQALRDAHGWATASLLNSLLAGLPACLISPVLHPLLCHLWQEKTVAGHC